MKNQFKITHSYENTLNIYRVYQNTGKMWRPLRKFYKESEAKRYVKELEEILKYDEIIDVKVKIGKC